MWIGTWEFGLEMGTSERLSIQKELARTSFSIRFIFFCRLSFISVTAGTKQPLFIFRPPGFRLRVPPAELFIVSYTC